MPMRARRVLRVTLPILLVAACSEEAPEPEPVVRPVKILEVGAAESGGLREFPGTVGAAQHAEMGFEVAGRVVEFPVEEGQRVEEGQELARLDDRDYRARLDSARALVEDARTNRDRSQILFDEGVTPKAELDRKRSIFDVQEANYREAEKALEDTVLHAPFSGIVATKLVKDFRNVQAKEPVLVLQDDSSFEIQVYIPERDVRRPPSQRGGRDELTARVQPKVSLSSQPGVSFPARVKEFSTSADPDTRTFRVTLSFDPPKDVAVLPGMTAKVTVRAEGVANASGYRIPAAAAIADDEGNPFVWVVDPETMAVERRSVELGELAEDEVTIVSGLSAGDQVAVSGVHQLREGMIVSRYGR
jgi:RND family efflux transporter MFP subunit